MQPENKPRNIFNLGPRHFLLLISILALLGFAVVFVVPSNPFRDAYWWYLVRPDLEQRFGFTTGRVEDGTCIFVEAVLPGGAFEKAGVKPGDAPYAQSCFGVSASETLFDELAELQGTRQMLFVEGGCQPGRRTNTPVSRVITAP